MPERPQDELPATIRFHYLKSNHFRVVHSDGIYGGLVSPDRIAMSFYSERRPIPKSVVYEVTENGLGQEVREARDSLDGVVREIDVEVMMGIDEVQRLAEWLNAKIEESRRISRATPSEPGEPEGDSNG